MTAMENQQLLKRLWEDQLTQDYLVSLGHLIASRSIFAQAVGLEETADYLKELFAQAGAEVIVDKTYAAPFVDRKSTRLNSSHANISYAVFCLKKKKKVCVEVILNELKS